MGSGPLWRVFLPWSVLRRVPRGLGSSQESHPLLERPQEGARGLGSSQESHPLLERPQEGACGLGSSPGASSGGCPWARVLSGESSSPGEPPGYERVLWSSVLASAGWVSSFAQAEFTGTEACCSEDINLQRPCFRIP